MFNIKQLLSDYKIYFEENGKNVHSGWIAVKCPLCQDHGKHGGFNIKSGGYRCLRCGSTARNQVLYILLNKSDNDIRQINKKYFNNEQIIYNQDQPTITKISFPEGTAPLQSNHINYLINRNFDPFDLQEKWGPLYGTGIYGNYKFRIIVPISLKGTIISYTGRDITNKQKERYKSCPRDEEVIHHKDVFYGLDQTFEKSVVVVEGITDVWRLSHGSISTFGTSFTNSQVNILSNNFDNIFILFDNEDIAQEKAQELAFQIKSLNNTKNVYIEKLSGVNDPGDLSNKEGKYIMKQIFSKV